MNWFIFGITLAFAAVLAIFIWTGMFLEDWVRSRWGSEAAGWTVVAWFALFVATLFGTIAK